MNFTPYFFGYLSHIYGRVNNYATACRNLVCLCATYALCLACISWYKYRTTMDTERVDVSADVPYSSPDAL